MKLINFQSNKHAKPRIGFDFRIKPCQGQQVVVSRESPYVKSQIFENTKGLFQGIAKSHRFGQVANTV